MTLASLIAVLVAAAPAAAPAPAESLDIELDESRIGVSASVVAAGPVRVRQLNAGRQEHELLIVRTKLPAADLPLGLEGVSAGTAGRLVYGKQHSHHTGTAAAARHLKPGEAKSERVRLAPGAYVLYCSLPGHYQAGQRAAISVR